MSGGHYNDFHALDCQSAFSCLFNDSLVFIIDDLTLMGHSDLAKDCLNLLFAMRAAKEKIEFMKDNLNPILRSLDLWMSSDTGEDDFLNDLAKYRSNK